MLIDMQRWIGAALFIGLATWCGLFTHRVAGTNDVSMYALTKSIATTGGFAVGTYEQWRSTGGEPLAYSDETPQDAAQLWMLTLGVDLAHRDGKLYSDRPPLTAALALPLYGLGDRVGALLPEQRAPWLYAQEIMPVANDRFWLHQAIVYGYGREGRPIDFNRVAPDQVEALKRSYRAGREGAAPPQGRLISEHERTRQYFALLTSGLATALAAALLFHTARMLGHGIGAALAAGLVYALCSVQAKYAIFLFSHATAGCLAIATMAMTVWLLRRDGPRRPAWGYVLLGFIASASIAAELPNALFSVGFIACLLASERKRRSAGLIAIGALAPLLALGAYNSVCFGRPWATGYAHQLQFAYNKQWATAFGGPWLEGLRSLLLDPNTGGVLTATPVFALCVIGLVLAPPQRRRLSLFVLALWAMYVMILAKKTVVTAGSNDPRYIAAGMGLLSLGAASWVDAWTGRKRWAGIVVLVAAACYCALYQFDRMLRFLVLDRPAARFGDIDLLLPGWRMQLLILPALLAATVFVLLLRRRLTEPARLTDPAASP